MDGVSTSGLTTAPFTVSRSAQKQYGVTAFFLEATHVHASDVDPSVCNSVVVLSVSHVDASEMASSSVVPPLHLIGAATFFGRLLTPLLLLPEMCCRFFNCSKDNRRKNGEPTTRVGPTATSTGSGGSGTGKAGFPTKRPDLANYRTSVAKCSQDN